MAEIPLCASYMLWDLATEGNTEFLPSANLASEGGFYNMFTLYLNIFVLQIQMRRK